MRDIAAWLELPGSPHPTQLRRATFSHEWEKGGALSSREPSSDPCFARATFSHEWEKGTPEFCGESRETTLAQILPFRLARRSGVAHVFAGRAGAVDRDALPDARGAAAWVAACQWQAGDRGAACQSRRRRSRGGRGFSGRVGGGRRVQPRRGWRALQPAHAPRRGESGGQPRQRPGGRQPLA